MDKQYLDSKIEKLNTKFQSIKDQALQSILDISNKLINDIKEINEERVEIAKLLEESNMNDEIVSDASDAQVEVAPEAAVESEVAEVAEVVEAPAAEEVAA